LQQRAHPRVVRVLGVEIAQRSAEQGRLTCPGGGLRLGMGPPEPVVVEQSSHVWVMHDQPRRIANLGSHPVDGAAGLQFAQLRRDLQRVGLFKRQL
jgi:hypothetical protein